MESPASKNHSMIKATHHYFSFLMQFSPLFLLLLCTLEAMNSFFTAVNADSSGHLNSLPRPKGQSGGHSL